MGKDKRVQHHQCLRCRSWLDDEDSELCPACEVEYLTEIENVRKEPERLAEMREHGLGFHGGISMDALAATHFPGLMPQEVSGSARFVYEYDDPLDQARADSLEGGE